MNTFEAILLICVYLCVYVPSASGKCGNCLYELCSSDEYCLYGCKPGYRGKRCRNTCGNSCQPNTDCYRDGAWINGRWRYKCELCQNGYYREAPKRKFNCSSKCPTNCKSCLNLNECNVCKANFYNEGVFRDCSRRCPENCESCLSPTLCMKCKPPYYNDIGVTNCSLYCFERCKECKGEKCSSCVSGYFDALSNCNRTCPSNCVSCSSSCDQCKARYFNKSKTNDSDSPLNENCEWNCRQNCSECTDFDTCQICINGTYGSVCENQCSVGCTNNICDKETGACDCEEFFSGDKCCVRSLYCKTCSSATECSVCKTGHFGDTCQENCSETCLGGCDINSGECNDCEINNYGRFCEKHCSQGCLDNGTLLCSASDGTCLRGCIFGYYGKQCDRECEATCKDGCNVSSGVCDDCFPNTYGLFCNSNCSSGCMNSSSSETICDHKTGNCFSCVSDKYGLYCNNSCPDNCFNQNNNSTKCNDTTGACLYGCNNGNYGEQCTEHCSDNCVQKTCNVSSGKCLLGCKGSYSGVLCMEALPFDDQENSGGEVASGVVVGVLVLALMCGAVIFLLKRRKKTDSDKTSLVAHVTPAVADSSNEPVIDKSRAESSLDPRDTFKMTSVDTRSSVMLEILPESELVDETIYANTEQQTYTNSTLKCQVSSLYDYVKKHTFEFFKEEFKLLPDGLIKPYTCAKNRENVIKNRYTGIYPYDDSRVKIKEDPTFFINACYIDGYSKEKAYIASLGPTKKAMENFCLFWKMVWYEHSDIIVMLTNLREATGTKCEQYWPDLGDSLTYGDVKVACHSEEILAEHSVRTFTAMKKKKKRTVTQLHYTAWPDKGVPDNIASLVEFWQRVRAAPMLTAGPVIVHCSAGIGRTGTYIALDRLAEEGRASGSVNVYGCVLDMRQQRVNMVQTIEQYIFLHKALAYTLTLQSRVLAVDWLKDSLTLTEEDIQLHFQNLSREIDGETKEEKKARNRNKDDSLKNREGADIPGDRHRPRLYLNRTSDDTDYVNAVYINSYRIKDNFIVAQTPLPSTVENFLCLIYQEDCCCIITLDDVSINAKNVGRYLPIGKQPLTAGPFTLEIAAECCSTTCFDQRQYILAMKNQPTKTIQHFHYTAWEQGQALPNSVPDFVDFVNAVKDNVDKIPEGRAPAVLVHCLTGAERSGLFCAVAVLREKIQYEGQVCVSNTLRQIKSRRKTAIPNKNQLEFCYQCVSAYVDINCVYSNFASVQTMNT